MNGMNNVCESHSASISDLKIAAIFTLVFCALITACSQKSTSDSNTEQHQMNDNGNYRFLLNASTNQVTGEAFDLSVAVLRLGVKQRYNGRLTFSSSDPEAELPPSYQFSDGYANKPGLAGYDEIRGPDKTYEGHQFTVTLNTEGNQTITVTDQSTGRQYTSNTILVSDQVPKEKLYFGDIHFHSQYSDGRKTPDYNYVYARDIMNLDFASLTDHDPTDYVWELMKDKAREMYEPGEFVTFSAYEWTGHKGGEGHTHEDGEGHKNVYYRDFEGPVFRSNFRDYRSHDATTADELWAKLRETGKEVLTIPHHTASRFPVPWEHHDPEFQRAVEIYSSWGTSEYGEGPRQITNTRGKEQDGHFVQDALAKGLRLGFVAASDAHSGRPGYTAQGRDYHDNDYSNWTADTPGGFTGVYADTLTREAIFDAIQNRYSYATTGQRIILDFKADGHKMGEEYATDSSPELFVKVIGTAPIASVTIVKNNQDYYKIEPGQRQADFRYTQTEVPDQMDYYYIRVIQEDEEMAWSSPIWVNASGK